MNTALPGWRVKGSPWSGLVGEALEQAPVQRRRVVQDLGPVVEDRERGPWVRREWGGAPDDRTVARLWGEAFGGDLWSGRSEWERLFLPTATRAFRGVFEALGVPGAVRSRALVDLREAFFHALVAGDWARIAARVAETGVNGPLESLRCILGSDGRAAVGACAAARGAFSETVARIWADRPDRLSRGRAFARALGGPDALEGFADTHAILRILEADDAADPWQVVVHNRRRLRSRVRATLTTAARAELGTSVRTLPGLLSRTRAAMTSWAWAFAWRQVESDFAFHLPDGPECVAPDTIDSVPSSDLPALRTWVLLCVLRGRGGHLDRWVRTGGTGDRDTSWGRLLLSLPDCLKDADGGYVRVRAELADELPAILEHLAPLFAALTTLAKGRTLPVRASEILRERWDPRIPFPQGGFPGMVDAAAARGGPR